MITRQWHIVGSVLALSFQLGGCGLMNDPPKPVASMPVVSKPMEKAEEPSLSRRHPPSAVPKPTKQSSPDDLIGLNENAVRKLLGSPVEMRNDNAARIFSYRRSSGCALDVILFMDLKAGDLHVLGYQWSSGSRPHEPAGCYAELQVKP